MKDFFTQFILTLFLFNTLYFLYSKTIFDKLNATTHTVIDEYFHLPQGISYCNGNFSYWDPKITTLPGLYLVSSIVGTFTECNIYNLRFVNLIASCINIFLFSSILQFVYYNDRHYLNIVLQAFNLALLPPLYFFSHVYYTDMLSLTFLLLFTRLALSNRWIILTFLFGVGSILMRQTNVIWIALVFGIKLLDIFIKSSRVYGNNYISYVKLNLQSSVAKELDRAKLKRYYGAWDLYCAMKYHLSTYFTTLFHYITLHDAVIMFNYALILGGFVTFVYLNGSIVVGDKTAHVATLHLPQLLYFLVFYGVFGLPYVISKLISTLKLMYRQKMLVTIIGMVFFLIVHLNTQVHPYLLADNRHFTFYIWNRWYGKYDYAIYASVPAYVFLLFSLYDNLKDQNCISFLLPYTICLFLSLALQKLIEVRYFLIPYIVLRLRFGRPSYYVVLSELLLYLAINVAAFHVFFKKEVYWKDFDYPQRIIW